MRTHLYSLSEPGGPVRYIGKTVQKLQARLVAHFSAARSGGNYHRLCWIRRMKYCVEIDLIETVDGPGDVEEKALIASLRSLGADLVNGTAGGDGMKDPSPETRAKMSAAAKKRKRGRMSQAARANISASARGKPKSATHRAALSAALKGRPLSTKTKKKMSLSRMGHLVSEETRAKLRAAHAKRRLPAIPFTP